MLSDLKMRKARYKLKHNIVLLFFNLSVFSCLLFIVTVILSSLSIINIMLVFICLLLTLVLSLTLYIVFSQFTNLYPLNDLPDDYFDKIKTLYLKGKEGVINIYEQEIGIWRIDNQFYFDMRDFIFQKSYICSYFIRNIHYPIINKNKLRLKKLFGSLATEKYTNFNIIFHYKDKTKECVIVQNSKTKTTPLRSLLIRSAFYLDPFGRYHKETTEYIHITEKIYNSRK